MAKTRLGKAERAIVRAYWEDLRSRRKALVQSNLSGPKPETLRLSNSNNLAGRMTHCIYRDQTVRGLRQGERDSKGHIGNGVKAAGFASGRTPKARKNPELKRPWYVKQDQGYKVQ